MERENPGSDSWAISLARMDNILSMGKALQSKGPKYEKAWDRAKERSEM